ncbi:hypothetical protein LAZ67_15001920 [Cordylochernes scorpioides]|uniref:MTP large subunit lipid-binding domain-containing protein n=1 Tax=Cordylochernes scorpioides TaxID=51811 RepID=A0ABY6LCQ3_9ARAC|nr:hypothetical protein LAZ67_15001920 [Cordylochernes scorpioides]
MSLKGRRFDTRESIIADSKKVLKNIPKDAFSKCFKSWEKRWKLCIDAGGDYFGDFIFDQSHYLLDAPCILKRRAYFGSMLFIKTYSDISTRLFVYFLGIQTTCKPIIRVMTILLIGAISVLGSVQVDSSIVQHIQDFNLGGEGLINFITDLDFYSSPFQMCVQMDRPAIDLRLVQWESELATISASDWYLSSTII